MTVAREPARAPEPDGGSRHTPGSVQPRGRAADVLALQRAAGNRAVAAAVRNRQAPAARQGPVIRPTQAERPSTATAAAIATPVPEAAGGGTPSAAAAAAAPVGEPVVQRAGLLDDLADAAGGVRDRILAAARDRARSFPGYTLLTVVLGKDPITDAPVERNGAALINGFLDIIPGSDRIRQPLQESRAVEKAGAWLDAEVPKLGLTFDYIRGLFDRVMATLGPGDLLDIPGAISRVMRVFSEPIQRLRSFASGAVKTLMEFVVEGAMALAGGAGGQIMGIIRRAGAAFDRIVADPMGFVANLVQAAKGGFLAFAANIGTHLRNGLISWLTGALGGVLRLPARLDLPGIVGMALDFLGLTWQRVRGRIVRLIPEPILTRLEQGAGLIADLGRRGLAAVTDRIAQFAEGIMDTVIGGIREWVTNNIVTQAVTKLVSMFNPAGAIVQAAIAIYNTIQFFIERGRQIAALGEAIFDSIEAIASGSIGGAIQRVEQALGRAVPVLLGFLSRLIGIGDIATPVRNVMQRVHGVIDGAIDRVLGWVAGLARRAAGALGLSGRNADVGSTGLGDALRDSDQLLRAGSATPATVRAALPGLRTRHGLRSAELVPGRTAGTFHVHLQRVQADSDNVALEGATDEGDGATVWDAVAESTLSDRVTRASGRPDRRGHELASTRAVPVALAAHAVEQNRVRTAEFIDGSPASSAEKSAARALVERRIAAAAASNDEAAIYRHLREAASRIQQLYGGRDAFGLDVEHLTEVAHGSRGPNTDDELAVDPETFLRTRISRRYAQVSSRIRGGTAAAGTPEQQIAAGPGSDQQKREIARLYAEQVADAELGDVGQTTTRAREVQLVIITTTAHRAVTSRRASERA